MVVIVVPALVDAASLGFTIINNIEKKKLNLPREESLSDDQVVPRYNFRVKRCRDVEKLVIWTFLSSLYIYDEMMAKATEERTRQ